MKEHLGIKGRDRIPAQPTSRDGDQVYRVWVRRPADKDWGPLWECCATFGYLVDCLDFIAELQDNGHDCVYQSPVGCRQILATDARTVAIRKPPRAPLAHLHRYKCECGEEWETTSEFDSDCECPDCGTAQTRPASSSPLYDDVPGLAELVRELYEWAAHMGGWESPVWDKVQALVNTWDKAEVKEVAHVG